MQSFNDFNRPLKVDNWFSKFFNYSKDSNCSLKHGFVEFSFSWRFKISSYWYFYKRLFDDISCTIYLIGKTSKKNWQKIFSKFYCHYFFNVPTTDRCEHTFPSIINKHCSAQRNVQQCFRERTKLNGEYHLLFHNVDDRCSFQRRGPRAMQKIGEIHVVEFQHVREEVNPLQFSVAR